MARELNIRKQIEGKTNVIKDPKAFALKNRKKKAKEKKAKEENQKAYAKSSEEARLSTLNDNMHKAQNSILWNLPGSISPLGAENIGIRIVGQGAKAATKTKLAENTYRGLKNISIGNRSSNLSKNADMLKEALAKVVKVRKDIIAGDYWKYGKTKEEAKKYGDRLAKEYLNGRNIIEIGVDKPTKGFVHTVDKSPLTRFPLRDDAFAVKNPKVLKNDITGSKLEYDIPYFKDTYDDGTRIFKGEINSYGKKTEFKNPKEELEFLNKEADKYLSKQFTNAFEKKTSKIDYGDILTTNTIGASLNSPSNKTNTKDTKPKRKKRLVNRKKAEEANRKAYEESSEQARLETLRDNMHSAQNSFLSNLPGSIAPMGVGRIATTGAIRGGKALIKGAQKVLAKEPARKGRKAGKYLWDEYLGANSIDIPEPAIPDFAPYKTSSAVIGGTAGAAGAFFDQASKPIQNRIMGVSNKETNRRDSAMKFIEKQDKKEVPKAIWGALIAAGVSAAIAVSNNQKEKSANKEADWDAFKRGEADKKIQDTQIAENVDTGGKPLSTPYASRAKGGIINTPSYNKGGNLKRVASDTQVVEGKTHEQGGVDIGVAEVENKELITQTGEGTAEVLSNRLKPDGSNKTYAEHGEKLATKKGKLEKELVGGATTIKKNTNTRMIEHLDKAQADLFIDQEQLKKREGIETPKVKKDFGGEIVPYLDNAVGLVNTLTKPKPIKARMTPAPSFNTEVNVNDQLSNVRDTVKESQNFIDKNTSSSRGARGERAKIALKGTGMENAILADKENKENDRVNQAVQTQAQYAQANSAISAQHNEEMLNRSLAQRTELGENVTNAVDYVQNDRKVKAEQALDLEKTQILADGIGIGGSSARNDLKAFKIYDYTGAKEMWDSGNMTPEIEALIRKGYTSLTF